VNKPLQKTHPLGERCLESHHHVVWASSPRINPLPCPRRGGTALAQGQHGVRSPRLDEVILLRPERVLLRGCGWILVEWIDVVNVAVAPFQGARCWTVDTQGCVALRLTLG